MLQVTQLARICTESLLSVPVTTRLHFRKDKRLLRWLVSSFLDTGPVGISVDSLSY